MHWKIAEGEHRNHNNKHLSRFPSRSQLSFCASVHIHLERVDVTTSTDTYRQSKHFNLKFNFPNVWDLKSIAITVHLSKFVKKKIKMKSTLHRLWAEQLKTMANSLIEYFE